MGREIRRVPKGWQHPKDDKGRYVSLYDQPYADAAKEWWENAVKWQAGDLSEKDLKTKEDDFPWYWEWAGQPPDEESHRPAFDGPADCYQIYETVSEGTPVSPVFGSVEQMIAWMTAPIDWTSEWNRNMADWQTMQGMTRQQAESFCGSGGSVSMMVIPGQGVIAGHRFNG